MIDQIISLETALLARAKGFNIRQEHFYNEGSGWKLQSDPIIRTGEDQFLEAPTQSLLQRWLREQYNLHIEVFCGVQKSCYPPYPKPDEWCFSVHRGTITHQEGFSTYEEALEAGLVHSLNLL